MAERVLELIQKASPYLAQHGSQSPRLDAELLLAQVLACSRMDLYLRFELEVGGDDLTTFRALCRRRASGEPVAYIRGLKEFMSLEFEVTPAVLVPRPETEVLAEAALARLHQAGPGVRRVLDVGTGSGAIAIALLVRCPELRAVGTDISAEALQVAARNAQRHDVTDRLELVETDLADGTRGPFDLVTANLPYIDPDWADGVEEGVARYEPAAALFAGNDGLALVERLLGELQRLLLKGGAALLEIDPRHAEKARQLAVVAGVVTLIPDLAGLARLLVVET